MLFTDSSKIVFKMFNNLQLLQQFTDFALWVESNVGAEQDRWGRREQTARLED